MAIHKQSDSEWKKLGDTLYMQILCGSIFLPGKYHKFQK